MKALRQLGFLKLSLRPERAPADEDHRVLELFRNRAELKKAYGSLQDETFRLKDLIKQQEGATQRVQEMLSTLEGRLGNPETAYRCAGVLPAARPVAVRARAARRSSSPIWRGSRRSASGACTWRSTTASSSRAASTPRQQLAAAQAAHAGSRRAGGAARGRARRASHASGTTSSAARSSGSCSATQAQLNRAQPDARSGAGDARGGRPRGSAGISGVVAGGTPLHQPRGDRLRRGAVPARRDPEDAARGARARGDRAA